MGKWQLRNFINFWILSQYDLCCTSLSFIAKDLLDYLVDLFWDSSKISLNDWYGYGTQIMLGKYLLLNQIPIVKLKVSPSHYPQQILYPHGMQILFMFIFMIRYYQVFIQKISKQMEASEQMKNKKQYFIKGSGTSYCLINDSTEDESQFIPFNFRPHLSLQDRSVGIKEISMAGLYLIIVLENGSTYKLGSFNNHQEIFKTPISVFSQKIFVKEVSSGWDHTIFRTEQNEFWGMGSNKFGELPGCEIKKYYYLPQKLVFLQDFQSKNIEKFICGFRQSYFCTSENQVYGCGQSKKYELGIKSPSVISFKKISNLSDRIKKLACAKRSVFALTQSGDLYVLGINEFKIFDHHSKKNTQNLEFIQDFKQINSNVSDVACGWTHVMIIKHDEERNWIESYGRNNFGQLGRQVDSESVVVDLEINCSISQLFLASGSEFSFCSVKGQVYGWGWNEHQNVCNSKEQSIQKPQKIQFPSFNGKCTRVWTYPAITIIQTS